MIAVASLQLRTGKSLAGERASECSALLPLCAKWRYCCEQKCRDQLVHALVLKQGCRCVEPHSNVLHYANRSTKANEADETALGVLRVCDTGLKAGVNGIDRSSVAE